MENNKTNTGVLPTKVELLEADIKKLWNDYIVELIDEEVSAPKDCVLKIQDKYNVTFSDGWESNPDYRYYEDTTTDGHSIFVGGHCRNNQGLIDPSEDLFMYENGFISDFIERLKADDFDNRLVQFEGVFDGHYGLHNEFELLLQEDIEETVNLRAKKFIDTLLCLR